MAFQKGVSGNRTGRPKGALANYTKAVKEVIADAFAEMQKDPKNNILAWGKKNPTEFYRLAAKLIPINLQGDLDMNIEWHETKNYESKR